MISNTNARKATALLAVLCMVSLNVGTLTSVYQSNQKMPPVTKDAMTSALKSALEPNIHHGRSLLWASSEKESNNPENNMTTDYIPKCSMNFNQSESIRLDSQLRGWFQPEPPTLANVTKKNAPTSPPIKTPKAQLYETSLGRYPPPLANGLTSGVYQMLITDPESKYVFLKTQLESLSRSPPPPCSSSIFNILYQIMSWIMYKCPK